MNPTNTINISFENYVNHKKRMYEKHMRAGVPDYAYGMDYSVRQKIKSMPGAYTFFKSITEHYVPQMREQINMSSLKVGPHQFPEVYQVTVECAKILGIAVPNVYITNDNTINAYTLATDDSDQIVVIHSGLLERFSLNELRFVIGHECGHIHNNHGVYTNAIALIENSLQSSLPVVKQILSLMSQPLYYAMKTWSRAAEVSADRAGVICSQNREDALSVLAKFTYGATFNCNEINIDEILKQYESLKNTPVRLLEINNDHPVPVRRLFAVEEFYDSQVLYSWRPEWKDDARRLVDKNILDQRVERYISVTKKGER